MAVIGINYTGGNEINEDFNEIENPINYESVRLSTSENEYTFSTGNFVKDWFDAKKKMTLEIGDTYPFLASSSDVDHFIMDGAKFDSAYLHIEGETPVLKYIDRTDPLWFETQKDVYEGSEFFVPEGTKPTWSELKEMCK